MQQDERLRLALRFGTTATAYAEHRPDYAQEAARWALEFTPGVRVLDLGAGTGKLTATLTAPGAHVTAVEPDPATLAELHRAQPNVRALAGSAEAIPCGTAPSMPYWPATPCTDSTWPSRAPRSPGSSHLAASSPACGTSWTTESSGLPG